MAEIWKWNTQTTADAVRKRDVSVREVVEAHIARLDEVNPALNAVTNDIREHARQTALARDEATASGADLGPLHGVPITIKENIDVTGQVTPNGMVAFADVTAPADSPLVSHFQSAGAVIVGRTNTPEMSYRWHTDNPLRGETRNPWSANRTAGGSSGGAAAAVAAGIGTIAHGNDLGGSVRQPANCCGLAGIRPTLGRVPAYNPSAGAANRSMALQLMSVQGPLAREVADVRSGLEIMSLASPLDPWHRFVPIGEPAGPVRVAASYGVPGTPVDPPVKDAVDASAQLLAAAGYDVEFIDPPHFEEVPDAWRRILTTETLVTPGFADLRAQGSSDFQKLMEWMFTDDMVLDLAGLVEAWGRRLTILRDWTTFMAERPIVLTPVSQRVPFGPNEDASSADRFFEIMAAHAPLVAMNYLGLPAATVPAVMTDDGPIGVQLAGAPFAEGVCLDAAAVIEAGVGVMAPHLWDRMAS